MNINKTYEQWLEMSDDVTKQELKAMNEAQINESFYRELEFGTGGLRGVIGAGTNRMNKYVVARATLGLADYINKMDCNDKSVVIAYDSRHFSKEFAMTSAKVLSTQNIKVYLFDALRPTPELSFAVRHLNATAGIVITASHNPAKYNGYKIYWSDGGQIPPKTADKILDEINKHGYFDAEFDNDKNINIIGEEIDKEYLNNVYEQSINKDLDKSDFRLVYTPLHGSGNKLVRGILNKSGFKNVIVVKEQEQPDGSFPTVKSPNPEDKECFDIAIKYAREHNADLIIGTDPDSDRVGIVVRNNSGEYETMTGNQVGVLLADYILSHKNVSEKDAVVTTIVSTKMIEKITGHYGVSLYKTLTGFKYIGEKIHEFEENKKNNFLFGFEESYGYLAGTYARDKDAVVASMLIAEMACYYSTLNMSLADAMNKLYEKFGGYCEQLKSITLEGQEGMKHISEIMHYFRNDYLGSKAAGNISTVTDYTKDTGLPKSDVLSFEKSNGVTVVIRPSGTEPKIKIYTLSQGADYNEAKRKSNDEISQFTALINDIIS